MTTAHYTLWELVLLGMKLPSRTPWLLFLWPLQQQGVECGLRPSPCPLLSLQNELHCSCI